MALAGSVAAAVAGRIRSIVTARPAGVVHRSAQLCHAPVTKVNRAVTTANRRQSPLVTPF